MFERRLPILEPAHVRHAGQAQMRPSAADRHAEGVGNALGIFEGDRLLSSSFPEGERVPSPTELGQLNLDRSNPLLTTAGGFGGSGSRVATVKVGSPSGDLVLEAAEPLREVIGE